MRFSLTLCLAFFCFQATAGEVKHADVRHKGNDYWLDLVMQVNAGQDNVFALLADHDNLHQISDVMVESTPVQGGPEGKTRRRIVVETCVLFFCFKVVMVEDVEEFSNNRIVAIMIPEQSNFRHGRAEWRIESIGPGRSELTYRCELQPDFWVPPAIGPFFMKRKMIREAKDTILNIESIAGRVHAVAK